MCERCGEACCPPPSALRGCAYAVGVPACSQWGSPPAGDTSSLLPAGGPALGGSVTSVEAGAMIPGRVAAAAQVHVV